MSSITLYKSDPAVQWTQSPSAIGSSQTLLNSTPSSTLGAIFSLLGGVIVDNVSAANTTVSTLHNAYLTAPTITATNTGIVTTNASTLTIAGPPVAGTNETITNAYALNVLAGATKLTNWIVAPAGTAAILYNSGIGSANFGTSFALYQGPGGDTVINTALGTSMGFKVGNNSQFSLLNTGTVQLGLSTVTGSPSTSNGSFLYLNPQTFTDTTSNASTTSGNVFSGTFLGTPTLAASNTGVTTTNASTLTIAGPPVAGTNQTITFPYSILVQNGISSFGGDIFVKSLSSTFVAGTQPQQTGSPSAYVWNTTASGSYINTLSQGQVNYTWSADGRFFYPNSTQPLLISWSAGLGTQCELAMAQNTTDGNTAFNTVPNFLSVSGTATNSEATFTYVWHPPSTTSYIGMFYFGQGTTFTAGSNSRNILKITRYH